VGGGLAALQQPSGGQDQRPGAHRPHHRHRIGGLPQVGADRRVAHGLDRGRAAAGDDYDLRVGDVAEAVVGGDGEWAVGGHGLEPLGHHHWPVLVVEPPQAGEDLQRADQIQQREPWVEHECDRLLLLGCHVHAPLAVRCCVTSTARLWHLLVGDVEAEHHVMSLRIYLAFCCEMPSRTWCWPGDGRGLPVGTAAAVVVFGLHPLYQQQRAASLVLRPPAQAASA
jgi:hypothetical protein